MSEKDRKQVERVAEVASALIEKMGGNEVGMDMQSIGTFTVAAAIVCQDQKGIGCLDVRTG